MPRFRALPTWLALLTIAGCADSCERVDRVDIYSDNSCLALGDSTQLVAYALNNGFGGLLYSSEEKPESFKWVSSAPNVATVLNGKVRALQLGDVTISSTTQGVKGEEAFTVEQPVSDLLIALSDPAPHVGDTIDVSVQAIDAAGQPLVGPKVRSYAANTLRMVSLEPAYTPAPAPYSFRAAAVFPGEASVVVSWSCLSRDMLFRDTTIVVSP